MTNWMNDLLYVSMYDRMINEWMREKWGYFFINWFTASGFEMNGNEGYLILFLEMEL